MVECIINQAFIRDDLYPCVVRENEINHQSHTEQLKKLNPSSNT